MGTSTNSMLSSEYNMSVAIIYIHTYIHTMAMTTCARLTQRVWSANEYEKKGFSRSESETREEIGGGNYD